MAETVKSRDDKSLKIFRKRKVMTAVELAALLNCSLSTAKRRFKQWNCYTSYNKNGRYYVLADLPKFDDNGLWSYRGICFSRHGNLTRTLVNLVKNSSAGLSASQIEGLLAMQSRSFLSPFRDHRQLRREKHQGAFVYFSSDDTIYARQKSRRVQMVRSARMPSDVEAVAILAESIKNLHHSVEELCVHLRKKGYKVTAECVTNLFAFHGLSLKKTPRSL
jgi:hypothetical protein